MHEINKGEGGGERVHAGYGLSAYAWSATVNYTCDQGYMCSSILAVTLSTEPTGTLTSFTAAD